jgi:hypothetical protein
MSTKAAKAARFRKGGGKNLKLITKNGQEEKKDRSMAVWVGAIHCHEMSVGCFSIFYFFRFLRNSLRTHSQKDHAKTRMA